MHCRPDQKQMWVSPLILYHASGQTPFNARLPVPRGFYLFLSFSPSYSLSSSLSSSLSILFFRFVSFSFCFFPSLSFPLSLSLFLFLFLFLFLSFSLSLSLLLQHRKVTRRKQNTLYVLSSHRKSAERCASEANTAGFQGLRRGFTF